MTDHERLLVALLSGTDTARDIGRVRYLELLAALGSIRTAPSLVQNAAWNQGNYATGPRHGLLTHRGFSRLRELDDRDLSVRGRRVGAVINRLLSHLDSA